MTTQQTAADVTVAIPYHNRIDLAELRAAVDSIQQQTCPVKSLQLVQDGPVDPQVALEVERIVDSASNIQLIIIPKNQGLAHALNVSILASQTQYYARMDADDISHPERIAKQVAYLEENSKVDVVGTWGIEFEHSPDEPNAFLKELPCEHDQIKKLFHYRDPLIHVSTMFRRTVFARLGIYDSQFRCNQDTEIWARALRLGGIKLANIPEPLVFIRTTGAVRRRASFSNILTQVRGRFRFNTLSPKLNALKIASLGLRLLPNQMQELAYRKLR